MTAWKGILDVDPNGFSIEVQRLIYECPSGDFMSRMNRLSGGPS